MSSISRIIAVIAAAALLGAIYYAFAVAGAGTGTPDGKNTSNQGERDIKVEKVVENFKISLVVPSSQANLGETLSLKLSVENVNSSPHELSFRSSQRFDFWIDDKSGSEIWRWSGDRMFAQMLETIIVEPNEKIDYTEDWPMTDSGGEPVSPGDYRIFANIVADELSGEELSLDITIEPNK